MMIFKNNVLPGNSFQGFPSGVANIQVYLGRLQENIDQVHPAVSEELNDGRVAVLVLDVQHLLHSGMSTEISQTLLNTLSDTFNNPVVDGKLNNSSAFRNQKMLTPLMMLEKEANYFEHVQFDSFEK